MLIENALKLAGRYGEVHKLPPDPAGCPRHAVFVNGWWVDFSERLGKVKEVWTTNAGLIQAGRMPPGGTRWRSLTAALRHALHRQGHFDATLHGLDLPLTVQILHEGPAFRPWAHVWLQPPAGYLCQHPVFGASPGNPLFALADQVLAGSCPPGVLLDWLFEHHPADPKLIGLEAAYRRETERKARLKAEWEATRPRSYDGRRPGLGLQRPALRQRPGRRGVRPGPLRPLDGGQGVRRNGRRRGALPAAVQPLSNPNPFPRRTHMPRKKPTKDEVARYVEEVTRHGLERAQAQGKKFREEDYLAGAMVWFFHKGVQDQLPANWIFGPLCNKSVFLENPEPKGGQ
jgi:hypothetical protein